MPEAVVHALTGHVTQIAAAYDQHGRDIYSYARAVTRDDAAAEDVTQETFLRLVREANAGRLPEDPRAWLYTVASNLLRSRARRRIVADRWRSVFARPDSVASSEDEVLRRERRSELDRALAALPTEHRMAFLLAASGFTGREVAAAIGRTEGATRNILWRSRLALRERLTSGGDA